MPEATTYLAWNKKIYILTHILPYHLNTYSEVDCGYWTAFVCEEHSNVRNTGDVTWHPCQLEQVLCIQGLWPLSQVELPDIPISTELLTLN